MKKRIIGIMGIKSVKGHFPILKAAAACLVLGLAALLSSCGKGSIPSA